MPKSKNRKTPNIPPHKPLQDPRGSQDLPDLSANDREIEFPASPFASRPSSPFWPSPPPSPTPPGSPVSPSVPCAAGWTTPRSANSYPRSTGRPSNSPASSSRPSCPTSYPSSPPRPSKTPTPPYASAPPATPCPAPSGSAKPTSSPTTPETSWPPCVTEPDHPEPRKSRLGLTPSNAKTHQRRSIRHPAPHRAIAPLRHCVNLLPQAPTPNNPS